MKKSLLISFLACACICLGSVSCSSDKGKHELSKTSVVTSMDMSHIADVAVTPSADQFAPAYVAHMSVNTPFIVATSEKKTTLEFVSRHRRCYSNGLVLSYNSHPKKFAPPCTVRYLSVRADV